MNESFSTFDWLLEHNDAYKVETTGENYMVASGVPNENENRHVFVIADIAVKGQEASFCNDFFSMIL